MQHLFTVELTSQGLAWTSSHWHRTISLNACGPQQDLPGQALGQSQSAWSQPITTLPYPVSVDHHVPTSVVSFSLKCQNDNGRASCQRSDWQPIKWTLESESEQAQLCVCLCTYMLTIRILCLLWRRWWPSVFFLFHFYINSFDVIKTDSSVSFQISMCSCLF